MSKLLRPGGESVNPLTEIGCDVSRTLLWGEHVKATANEQNLKSVGFYGALINPGNRFPLGPGPASDPRFLFFVG